MQKVAEIHGLVRSVVFDHLPAGQGICFSLYRPEDAGPLQLGDLFHQDADFMMVEVRIDEVQKSGPGIHSPNRVFGGLEITFHTKDRFDEVGAQQTLEAAGNWFAQETIDGVRFREFVPTGDGRDRGFMMYSGTVVFEFETQPKQQWQ